MLIIPSFTPMFAGLSQFKTVLGYSELYGQEDFDLPKYSSFNVLSFSKRYDYNVNIMISLQCLALFMNVLTYRKN